VAGAVAVPVAHLVFAAYAQQLSDFRAESFVTLAALMLPYLCFGAVIALLLVSRRAAIGRAYAANLAGSGAGCIAVFPLLDGLGAERALLAIALLSLLAAVPLASSRAASRVGLAAAGAALVAALATAPSWLDFPPERMGQLHLVMKRSRALKAQNPGERVAVEHLYERWDRTARVDVYRLDSSIPELRSRPTEALFFVQDSSAGSILLDVRDGTGAAAPFFEKTVYGAGYALGVPDDVLVIGLGGAPDVLTAIHHGAKQITGVEINRATIELVSDHFREHLGAPYQRPGVTVHRVDGRTFLRGAEQSFDLIQLSGVDTKSAFASGALSINENYIYTREAMNEMLRRLAPDGVLSITRFGDPDLHRLVSIAAAGLRDLGATQPELHLFSVWQGLLRTLLIKPRPFQPEEIERLHAWVRGVGGGRPGVVIPAYNWIGLSLDHPMRVAYSPPPGARAVTPFLKALASGRLEAFVADEPSLDLSSPEDDRPFFFFRLRPAHALQLLWAGDEVERRPGLRVLEILNGLLVQLGLIAVVLILVPLVSFRMRGLRAEQGGRVVLYFGCLGVAFMFVEIGLIQRFVLLLGHQSYAISVVLFGLLLGASGGSLLSTRLSLASRRPLATVLAALAALIVAYGFGLPLLFELAGAAPFAARLVLALLLLAALGCMLGIPFPAAMRAIEGSGAPLVAWALGVNGFTSVLGSTLAVEVAMLAGLRALLLLAAGLYLVALLAAPGLAGHRAR